MLLPSGFWRLGGTGGLLSISTRAQDAEYDAAVRYDEDRNEAERQREEAEQALAAPVPVVVVRAARLRRLATPTSGRENSSTGGGSS